MTKVQQNHQNNLKSKYHQNHQSKTYQKMVGIVIKFYSHSLTILSTTLKSLITSWRHLWFLSKIWVQAEFHQTVLGHGKSCSFWWSSWAMADLLILSKSCGSSVASANRKYYYYVMESTNNYYHYHYHGHCTLPLDMVLKLKAENEHKYGTSGFEI